MKKTYIREKNLYNLKYIYIYIERERERERERMSLPLILYNNFRKFQMWDEL